jgi:predicted kinase
VKTIYLIRGLPGSGKTSLAYAVKGRAYAITNIVAADDYFYDGDGVYRFDPKLLTLAHEQCQLNARIGLQYDGHDVVVHNTFSQRWEMQPYIDMADEHGARLVVLDLFDGGCTDDELAERNSHGVPLDVIERMRHRWEHDWRTASPDRTWKDGAGRYGKQ